MITITNLLKFFYLLILCFTSKVVIASSNIDVVAENSIDYKAVLSQQLLEQPFVLENVLLLQRDGKEVYLYNINKDKFIILNFFAPWIPECKYQLNSLYALQERLKVMKNDQIKIINIAQDYDKTLQYLAKEKIKLDFYFDPNGHMMHHMGINMPPAVVLLNKNKEVLAKYMNTYNWNEKSVLEFIEKLNK